MKYLRWLSTRYLLRRALASRRFRTYFLFSFMLVTLIWAWMANPVFGIAVTIAAGASWRLYRRGVAEGRTRASLGLVDVVAAVAPNEVSTRAGLKDEAKAYCAKLASRYILGAGGMAAVANAVAGPIAAGVLAVGALAAIVSDNLGFLKVGAGWVGKLWGHASETGVRERLGEDEYRRVVQLSAVIGAVWLGAGVVVFASLPRHDGINPIWASLLTYALLAVPSLTARSAVVYHARDERMLAQLVGGALAAELVLALIFAPAIEAANGDESLGLVWGFAQAYMCTSLVNPVRWWLIGRDGTRSLWAT